MHTKDEMKGFLRNNVVLLTFEKKDGTERTMRCTLMESLLPTIDLNVDKRQVKKSDSSLAVWDLDKNAWRSYRVDSVRTFEVVSA